MSLSQQLSEYIAACFTGLWVRSHEHDDALAEIAQLCQQESWRLAVWDIVQGLRISGQGADTAADAGGSDPLAAIQSINALASPDSPALLVLVNFHRFLGSPEIVQALAHQISQGKHNRSFIVILSPIVDIPTELDKLFVVVEHELPGREQLAEIARGIATEDDELPPGERPVIGAYGSVTTVPVHEHYVLITRWPTGRSSGQIDRDFGGSFRLGKLRRCNTYASDSGLFSRMCMFQKALVEQVYA